MFQFLPDGSRVFRVRVDVHEFLPEELDVRSDGGRLVISGRQSEKTGDRQRRRQFTKTFDLPDEVDCDKLVSTLGSDGVLTVEAPANPPTYQAVINSRDRPCHVMDHTRRSPPINLPNSDDMKPGSQVINTGRTKC